MKTIGITGGSGSGKSTVAELLKENLGNTATILRVDDLMHEYTRVHSQELLEYLGLEEDDGLLQNHLSSSISNIENWISYIASDIKREVTKAIADREGEYSVIILDWAFLPLVKGLFEECDITIRVGADPELKRRRLRARLAEHNKDEKWYDEALNKRIENSDLQGIDYTSNFIVTNDCSIDNLRIVIGHLSDYLKGMNFTQDEKKI